MPLTDQGSAWHQEQQWQEKVGLTDSTKALIMATQKQALSSSFIEAGLYNSWQYPTCRLCRGAQETVLHKVKGYKMQARISMKKRQRWHLSLSRHLSNCQRWSRRMGQTRESPSTVELIKQPLRWPFRRNSYHNWTCLKSGWGDRNEREGPRGRNTSARKNVQDSASVWTAASSQKGQPLWEMGTLAKGGLQRRMRLREKRFCNNIRSFFF